MNRMSLKVSYTVAQANLATLLDHVSGTQQKVIVTRRGKRDVVMVRADELTGLMETAHLLASPSNATRLSAALRRAKSNQALSR